MSKELEALERIGKLKVEGLKVVHTKTIVKDYADFEIIETALKRLGFLEKWFFEDKDYKNHKALEIIKVKNVCIHDLEKSKTLEEYNGCREWGEELTLEEYDLLKEVLL